MVEMFLLLLHCQRVHRGKVCGNILFTIGPVRNAKVLLKEESNLCNNNWVHQVPGKLLISSFFMMMMIALDRSWSLRCSPVNLHQVASIGYLRVNPFQTLNAFVTCESENWTIWKAIVYKVI